MRRYGIALVVVALVMGFMIGRIFSNNNTDYVITSLEQEPSNLLNPNFKTTDPTKLSKLY